MVGSFSYTTQGHWDAYGRSTGYVLQKNGNRACRVSQAYGTYGRISVESFIHANVEQKFHYGYLHGSEVLQTLSIPNGVTLTQEYEGKRNPLISMGYVRDNNLVTQRQYTYDALARPETRDTRYPNKGISHNDSFTYNYRSELTGALLDNSAYTYAYDNIVNRETSQEAAEGITYAANELNQYTRISSDGENFTPEYDADGNQTRMKTATDIWSAEYNAQNRAVRYTRENADGTRTVITADYDYMERRAWKKVESITSNPETGEETTTVTLHHRYIYRGYQANSDLRPHPRSTPLPVAHHMGPHPAHRHAPAGHSERQHMVLLRVGSDKEHL